MTTVKITHYSDILCVWAYLGQIRVEELMDNFAGQVEVDYCLFPVFGAVDDKINAMWGKRGGIEAYSQHVIEISQQHDHAPVHEDIWVKHTPQSSLPAHLYLSATKLLEQGQLIPKGSSPKLAKLFRHAFFTENMDISNSDVLASLTSQSGLPLNDIQQSINSGRAFATMASDIQNAKTLSISSSPTMLFNENRQRLTGNVGYRIVEANIRELLEKPESQQTWC